jgi:hypothetical protein
MRRSEPCAHLRPAYDRLEVAHHIRRDPVTDEISWEPTRMMDELKRLGLVDADCREDRMEAQGTSR